MRLRFLLAAAVLAASVAPAVAQGDDPLALFAKIAAGLADGGKVGIGTLGVGDVARNGKAYTVTMTSGAATFSFEQPQPCVFTELSEMQGQPTLMIRFDLAKVSDIKFADEGPYNGLNAVTLSFEGNGDLVQLVDDKGNTQAVPPTASIVTSLSVDELGAAVRALQAACPAAK